jgi:hypothetical protein
MAAMAFVPPVAAARSSNDKEVFREAHQAKKISQVRYPPHLCGLVWRLALLCRPHCLHPTQTCIHVTTKHTPQVSFSLLSQEQVLRMSHVQITSKELYTLPNRKPTVGGILDQKMVCEQFVAFFLPFNRTACRA